MEKCAKTIRIITIAPLMACMMLVTLYLNKPHLYGQTANFICGIFFLTVLPVLAYPLQRFIPHYKDKGREGQRSLAMIFAVCGYVLGCLVNLFMKAPEAMWVIYLEYLLSGACILLFNKCFHLKASGHACGVAGPLALLVYFKMPVLVLGFILLALTWWASLKTKRHTLKQLTGGTVIPLVVIGILYCAFGLL